MVEFSGPLRICVHVVNRSVILLGVHSSEINSKVFMCGLWVSYLVQIGLLGKANVGKSTFFSAATQISVQTGNFPFTTIKPNVGVAYVRTECACKSAGVEHVGGCDNGIRNIPFKLIDVAGLVPGAHVGKGLGNQFLDDARQASALIHVVDIAGSTDIQGQPVRRGTHDPLEDLEFVQSEFDQWFLQILHREWEKLRRELAQQKTKLAEGIARRFSGLGISSNDVQAALAKASLQTKQITDWTDGDLLLLASTLRKLTRPIIVAANKADWCPDLDIIKKIDGTAIPCSAGLEMALRTAAKVGLIDYTPGSEKFAITKPVSPHQQKALDTVRNILSKIGTTGVQRILDSTIFDMLGMIVVYPVEDETKFTDKNGTVFPDAKLLAPGSTAKDLAETVHADIAKGFLYGIDCKTGQRIGADHKLHHGDIVKIVSAGSRR